MKAHKLADDSIILGDIRALEIRRRQRETWLVENREAIEAYNELVTRSSVFSTGMRGTGSPSPLVERDQG
jgi:hypothetical protein